jgi:hypothetical protein
MSSDPFLRTETYRKAIENQRIGTHAARQAMQENRELGIPNAYDRDGKLYFELPDGTITQKNPFDEEPQE